MKITNLNLFPAYVKIIDFDDDPGLNDSILELARKTPALNDSTTDCNLLGLRHLEWLPRLRSRFNDGLKTYLREIRAPGADSVEVDAYMFVNYSEESSFTPYHNHVGDGDLVAIYYAHAFTYGEERQAGSYYAMEKGVLVLHDPTPSAGLDRRSLETAEHYYPGMKVDHNSMVEAY